MDLAWKVIVLVGAHILVILLALLWIRLRAAPGKKGRVVVLVLGDIGRSPRMQYHCLSIAKHGFEVHLVGYKGKEPLHSIQHSKGISIHYIDAPRKLSARSSPLLYIGQAVVRILRQIWQLMDVLLFRIKTPGHILVQNPPAIPTLIIVQFIRAALGSRLIIDWHNFGYSIMALTLGQKASVVRLARWYERTFGAFATAHLCVSKAMAAEIRDGLHARGRIAILYDRPPEDFRRLSLEEIHEFTSQYDWSGDELKHGVVDSASSAPFSYSTASGCQFRANRPKLVVSSTSWTEDEDFGILLDAVSRYDEEARRLEKSASERLSSIVIVITGRGPLLHFYKEKIRNLKLQYVEIKTAWLSAEHYPLLLGSADLGISLHTSSSGVDLPMKIVDMFGCGLPACAIGYQCLDELVVDGQNGRIFWSAEELCAQIKDLLHSPEALERLRAGTSEFQKRRWHTEWTHHAKCLFDM
ncbi:chitobiosyldiphosphodolichol beta-mannosyltransferase [Spizellomyces sp. 'palustris']|nr:chitobiosyldiphosphodolichol beta-mannosyltransferase [Spizellomyces sp. 'palustris']